VPAWHLYVVRSGRGDELARALTAAGIGNKAYYRTPTHRQPAMKAFPPAVALTATDEAARTHLAVPMSPALTAEQVSAVTVAARNQLGTLAA
jgi:dTDP-4-amino-4,6-dideoxygalactose transaminase